MPEERDDPFQGENNQDGPHYGAYHDANMAFRQRNAHLRPDDAPPDTFPPHPLPAPGLNPFSNIFRLLSPFNDILRLLNPSVLKMIFYILLLLGAILVFLLYFVKGAVGEVLDGVTSVVSLTWTAVIVTPYLWAVSKVSPAQQTPQWETDPTTVAPFSPLIDTWISGIQVGQFTVKQLQHVLNVSNEDDVDVEEAKKVKELMNQYQKELAAALANTRPLVQFLIKDIQDAPLSALCWGGLGGFWNRYVTYRTSNCRRKLRGQLKTLAETFQLAIDTRLHLIAGIEQLQKGEIRNLRVKMCHRRDTFRGPYYDFAEKREKGDSEIGKYLSQVGQLVAAGDIVCHSIEFDYSVIEGKINFMADEVAFLEATLNSISRQMPLAEKAAGQKAGEQFESFILFHANRWLKMTDKYYEDN
ncbi:hypothetical protein N0V84_012447 [Fusarium piperis]|uniref:Uncharacterized protein n=1 Tax=Fusarium piperis TaxID=1435070 RepID=A0A9W8VZS9_9HYPO|nr:hypothetical protein N0V84_012447 [Fusarium piperis]